MGYCWSCHKKVDQPDDVIACDECLEAEYDKLSLKDLKSIPKAERIHASAYPFFIPGAHFFIPDVVRRILCSLHRK